MHYVYSYTLLSRNIYSKFIANYENVDRYIKTQTVKNKEKCFPDSHFHPCSPDH